MDSPWENGYVELFNVKLRDDLLNRESFLSLEEARWVIDRWQLDYNHHRIHLALYFLTPVAYAARGSNEQPICAMSDQQLPHLRLRRILYYVYP